MKVVKIGGGCLRNGSAAKKILDLIAERGKGDIFVLSAFYGVTDILISGINQVLEGEDNVSAVISVLDDLHKTVIQDLGIPSGNQGSIQSQLKLTYQLLERYYYGIAFTREATPRMQDMVATFGERMSAMILAHAAKDRGLIADYVLPESLGIVSDGKFTDASALIDKTTNNVKSWLTKNMQADQILFVPGFYGISESGEVTTFGRGGSDYSAAVVAAAAGADILEVWKDTEGFMTADPDNIPHCKLIPKLTYEEAAELSYTGAGILHPRTVEPVQNSGIDIAIKNTYKPDATGSLITHDVPVTAGIIKSVSYTNDIGVIKIDEPGVGARFGFLARVLKLIGQASINLKSVITSQTCISLLVSRDDVQAGYDALVSLNDSPHVRTLKIENVALVSIVGKGLYSRHGIAAKCFSAVANAHINIEMISSGTSEAALYFIVNDSDLDATIEALHAAFFES